jgi:putative nucleotidyltransferase with HDIG domain
VKPLSPAAQRYLAAVITAGALVLCWSAWDLMAYPPPNRMWLVLLALTCLSSTFSIRIPKASVTISVSETFLFLCALLYGPSTAVVVVAADGLLISTWRGYRPAQLLFNMTMPALSLFAAARVFAALAGHEIGAMVERSVVDAFVPFCAFTLAYFVMNSGMNAAIVSLQRREALWKVWRTHFGVVLLNYCGAASVAALLIYNSREFNLSTIAIVLPLLLISYFTFKTTLQRVEDANRHLEEVNRLYLSTIETLAMAVDATDQVTHGHIRRVQSWAVGLARALGVTDENQLKAIQAAALLHDVGKLAIPEHILNKPGRLSPAEIDMMKRHASIGADILSSIEFPYPVVPIVRHHHEQWNGCGYPAGLSGADIPIGARILSVVDCFDALTSDRPYRRALSDEQALSMLVDQRGQAYDPLVVDTFARVFREIAPAEAEAVPGRRNETMREIAETSLGAAAATESSSAVPALSAEALPVAEVLMAGSPHVALGDTLHRLSDTLLRLTPATLCVIYAVDDQAVTLIPVQAAGELGGLAMGCRIGVGERLSGWVAANRQTVCNSDGALDFPDHRKLASACRSCLSLALVSDTTVEGVVSLYAPTAAAFDDTHRQLMESAARPMALLLRSIRALADVERWTCPSALATVPVFDPTQALERLGAAVRSAAAVSVHAGTDHPLASRATVMARAVAILRRALRDSDVIYRNASATELVALMPGADGRRAAQVAGRVIEQLSGLDVTTGSASAPADTADLLTMIDLARRRTRPALYPADPPAEHVRRPRQAGLFEDTGERSRTGVA